MNESIILYMYGETDGQTDGDSIEPNNYILGVRQAGQLNCTLTNILGDRKTGLQQTCTLSVVF